METQDIQNAIEELQKQEKRNFKQTFDMIIALRGLDLKKPDNQLDFYVTLHYPHGIKRRICGLVGTELYDQAKEVFDTVIHVDEFSQYEGNKQKIKHLADNHDFFVAQADVMAQVAKSFGRVLGPKKKMPNPKAGCVVPPKADLEAVKENLHKLVHIQAKSQLMVQASVGKEDLERDQLIDNIQTIYNQVLHTVPGEHNNIKSVLLKLTMSKPVKLE